MNNRNFSFLASLGLTTCLTITGSAALAQSVDRVTVAQGVYPVTFDPQKDPSITTMNVNSNIFDSLVTRGTDMSIVSGLAESWEQIEPTVLEMVLRDEVVFSNGEPFTAEDVKFSLDRVLDPEGGSAQRGWISTVDSIEVVDPQTVRIHTAQPDPALLARLTLIAMVPDEYTTEVGAQGLADAPVGTGPYVIGEWQRGDYVDLDINPTYWGEAPEIEHARFRAISDTAARVAALSAGDADIVTALPPDFATSIASAENTEVATVESSRVLFISLVNTNEGPLTNQLVRQAINHAVNKEAIIEQLLLGNGVASGDVNGHLLRLLGEDYESDIYAYDPDRARDLLAEAGYPDGFSIAMDTPNGRYPMDRDVAQVVAAQLGEVGIDVDLRVQEWGTYTQMFTSHNTAPMYLLGWSLPSLDPDSWATPQLGEGEPLANFEDEEIWAKIEEAKAEMDPDARLELYREFNDLVNEKAPWLFLYQQIDLYGYNTRIDFEARSDEGIRLNQIGLK